MTKDALDSRLCNITVNEGAGKTTVSTKKLVISLGMSLPILLADTATVTEKTVTSTLMTVPLNLNLIPNGITDVAYLAANGVERYTYIGSCVSGVTKTKLRIYGDGLYKDIFIIPELSDLGKTGVVNDPTEGHTFNILGYHVGGGVAVEVERSNYTIALNDTNKFDLPPVNGNIQLSVIEARFHGLTPKSSLDMSVGITLTTETTVYSSKDKLSTVIDLGAYTNLFSVSAPIPIYQLYQRSANNFTTKYLGTRVVPSTNNLYIPLDF